MSISQEVYWVSKNLCYLAVDVFAGTPRSPFSPIFSSSGITQLGFIFPFAPWCAITAGGIEAPGSTFSFWLSCSGQ